jgi:3-hydroxyisobutyrate dehydrogenase-like beta-hydroxyacid dehydrogenase
MLQGSYSPAFPLKHQQKDMRLALALGDENAVSMPVSAAANEVRLHSLSTCAMPHRTQGLSENT